MSIDKIPVPRSTYGGDRSVLAGHALVKMLIESREARVAGMMTQPRRARVGEMQIGFRGERMAGVKRP